MKQSILYAALILLALSSCKKGTVVATSEAPFDWKNATIYFLLTDRFNNGDTSNDFIAPADAPAAPLRGFMGGDIKGVTQKIALGYFDSLGVTAIWTTPVVENILGSVDEGTGLSYGFHGYWTKDWTKIDSRVGTMEDYKAMVAEAHKHGIRIIMDVVLNHVGPENPLDANWPNDWAKTGPPCTYKDKESTINCTLVKNLPDIRTESSTEVALPANLVEKWKVEGRYDQEVAELEKFFERTKLPRTPANYIVKWLTDYVEELGIDGYRIDTAKHVEGNIWKTLITEAKAAFKRWKTANPKSVLNDDEFFTTGEVYFYSANGGLNFSYGDTTANYYADGMYSLINFDFKHDAKRGYDTLFAQYDTLCNMGVLKDYTTVNYLNSHDDGHPYDRARTNGYAAAIKLLLSPGIAQIYYGDETNRRLDEQADGDAKLRSFMNWSEGYSTHSDMLTHWQKIGTFRKNHVATTRGNNTVLSANPYVSIRSYNQDQIVIALQQNKGSKTITLQNNIPDGTLLVDHYSGKSAKVTQGNFTIDTPYDIVLLSK